MTAPLRIAAHVDRLEHDAVRCAAEFFARAIRAALPGRRQGVSLTFGSPHAPVAALPAADVHIAALLPEIGDAEDMAVVRQRWRDRVAALQACAPLVVLCNVFRHVPTRNRAGGTNPLLTRIRALNLMAIELSHETGIGIADIDRVMAHFGARKLQTDYRLGGRAAPAIAGHTIALTLLAGGLDALIDPAVQQAARTSLGEPGMAPALLAKLTQQKQQQQQQQGRHGG